MGDGNQLVLFGRFLPSHTTGDHKLMAENLLGPLVSLAKAIHGCDVLARIGSSQ
jgi:hypothetical protein